jgi:hypothetical protein
MRTASSAFIGLNVRPRHSHKGRDQRQIDSFIGLFCPQSFIRVVVILVIVSSTVSFSILAGFGVFLLKEKVYA